MTWHAYVRILQRRWKFIALILILDVVGSGYLYAKSARHVGFQGCTTLYVADVSSPSVTLETTDQLLAGETAANFFADDILDIAQSSRVADAISRVLRSRSLPFSSPSDLPVSGSRRDRTIILCVANPNSGTALAASRVLGDEMTVRRSAYVGSKMAQRTFVRVVSPAVVSASAATHERLNFLLRLILGLLVALGLGLLLDAVDPAVRDRSDVEQALKAPVLAEQK